MLAEKRKAPSDSLPGQLFAPHFVLSTPEHADLLPRVPEKVRIEFDFNLHSSSNLTLTKDAKPVVGVKTSVRQLSIDATLPGDSGAGIYLARYKACWPDGSCHDGQFAFEVEGESR
jgi:methionine-rich copper-binding protein CopC